MRRPVRRRPRARRSRPKSSPDGSSPARVRCEEHGAARTAVDPGGLHRAPQVGLHRHVADGVVDEDRVELPVQTQRAHVAEPMLALRVEGAADVEHGAGDVGEQQPAEPTLHSPWWNLASHRERRGARLTRREEGAYWAYATDNNAVRWDASLLECSGDFHHGLFRCSALLPPPLPNSSSDSIGASQVSDSRPPYKRACSA